MKTQEENNTSAERKNPNAIRDHLANERTLLAWVRTTLAIIAMGFVVARFGYLLEELGMRTSRSENTSLSTIFGTALVLIGGGLMIPAVIRYVRAVSSIERNEYEHSTTVGVFISIGMVVVAVLLAAYLLVTGVHQ